MLAIVATSGFARLHRRYCRGGMFQYHLLDIRLSEDGYQRMTSQAFGKRNLPEVVCLLLRSVGIGVAVAVLPHPAQNAYQAGALLLIHPTDEVREMATLYFHICIWGSCHAGAIRTDGMVHRYVNSVSPMYIAITHRMVNIIASLGLVYLCGM